MRPISAATSRTSDLYRPRPAVQTNVITAPTEPYITPGSGPDRTGTGRASERAARVEWSNQPGEGDGWKRIGCVCACPSRVTVADRSRGREVIPLICTSYCAPVDKKRQLLLYTDDVVERLDCILGACERRGLV